MCARLPMRRSLTSASSVRMEMSPAGTESMAAAHVRFWPAVIASSVVATLLSTAINFGIDVWYHKPYERARERAQRSREGANLALEDRKSTRLNSSHVKISYAVF